MSQPPVAPRDQTTLHDFEVILARYSQAVLEYKTTGNSSFKMQADVDKKWLDEYIRWLETQSDTQRGRIQAFLAEYQTANPDLVKLQGQLRSVQDQGPKLQNELDTIRESTKEEPFDYTQLYIKGGLIAGVLGLIAVSSTF